MAAAHVLAVLAGCSLAPALVVPPIPAATSYKESGSWVAAQPADRLPRDRWWRLYGSAELDELERRLAEGNPTLAAALAHYAAAQALRDQARAGFYPNLALDASVTRQRDSAHQPLLGPGVPRYYDDNLLGGAVSYELDLWGRIRNEVAASAANAAAAQADLENARLSLAAQLADDYVQLRSLDRQSAILEDTASAYDRALNLTRQLHDGGIVAGLDVSQAQTQLASARAQLDGIRAQRALVEHAIGASLGVSASTFAVAPAIVILPVPPIPVGVPSTLLERRPDVAAAQRRMMAANAAIGVARAAYFPTLNLGASGGFQSSGFTNWLTAPSRYWAVGPQALLTAFDGGLRRAQVAQARAEFDAAAADYRAVAVAAFSQVEDGLAQLHHYGDALGQEEQAVAAARRSVELSTALYAQGAADYLTVVSSQAAYLQAQLQALALETARLRASVALIRALGGGWVAAGEPREAPES